MKLKKRDLILPGLAITLALAVFVGGGTYSYLNSSTGNVVNEFDANQVSVILAESTGNAYHIIPGTEEKKDPTVTLKNTVDAYVFVKVTDTTEGLVTYKIADGWKLLEGYNDVYYQEVTGSDTEQVLSVLKDNKVSYDASLENSEMLDENGNLKEGITLSFQAYAIQEVGFSSAVEAYLSKISRKVTNETEFVQALEEGYEQIVIDNEIVLTKKYTISQDTTIVLNANLYNARKGTGNIYNSVPITVATGVVLTIESKNNLEWAMSPYNFIKEKWLSLDINQNAKAIIKIPNGTLELEYYKYGNANYHLSNEE